jgi:hypothetical protein
MPLDITSKAQCSKYINGLTKAANALFALQDALQEFATISDVNDIQNVLGAAGADFPDGITVTPSEVNDARFAMILIQQDLDVSIAAGDGGRKLGIDKVRLSLGVLSGT